MVDEQGIRIEAGEVHRKSEKQVNDMLRQFGNGDDPVAVTVKQYGRAFDERLSKFCMPNV